MALDRGTAETGAVARSWQADLLHLNLPSQAAGLQVDLPIVVASHSCLPTWWHAVRGTELPADWVWQRHRNLCGFERADAIVVPSESHGAALSRVYGSLPPLRVIHNATAVARRTMGQGGADPAALAAGGTRQERSSVDLAAKSLPWPVVLAGPTARAARGNSELPQHSNSWRSATWTMC